MAIAATGPKIKENVTKQGIGTMLLENKIRTWLDKNDLNAVFQLDQSNQSASVQVLHHSSPYSLYFSDRKSEVKGLGKQPTICNRSV